MRYRDESSDVEWCPLRYDIACGPVERWVGAMMYLQHGLQIPAVLASASPPGNERLRPMRIMQCAAGANAHTSEPMCD